MSNIISNNSKKNLAIYLFANKKFLFALGTFIINLKDKFNKYDCIIIYHQDFNDDDMDNIRKIEKKVMFIKYDTSDFCKEFNYTENQIKDISAIKRFTVLGITRFKIFKHLREFKTVILFECDMLLTDDISELLSIDYNIAWKTDVGSTILGKIKYTGIPEEKIQHLPVYSIYQKAITPNAGFVIINDNFDYESAYLTAFNYVKNYFLIHPFLIGEYTLAYIKHILNLKLLEVDRKIYNVTPINVTLKTKLIHFFSEYKPWKKEYIQYAFRKWIDYYFEYIKITKNKSQEVILFENIGDNYIRQSYTKERWARLFADGFTYPKDLVLQPTLNRAVLSFNYNNFITYDIDTPIFLDELYNCRLWIKITNNSKNEIIKDEIKRIISTHENIVYIEYKQSFGCQTRLADRSHVQDNFNMLYEISKNIREISKSI